MNKKSKCISVKQNYNNIDSFVKITDNMNDT